MSLPLFVYGTLMARGPRGGMLAGLERCDATVPGALYDLRAGYPALHLGGDGRVHGELIFGIAEDRLAVLDFYEGVQSGLYRRVEVTANAGLEAVRCWCYAMDRPWEHPGRPVPSGRWKARRR